MTDWPHYFIPPAQVNESAMEFDARLFASHAHDGQKRKYTGEPYIMHPSDVVSIIRPIVTDERVITAAWLHDVVEDCNVSPEMIEETFDRQVRDYVMMLTDVSKLSDGNRRRRKEIDRYHTSQAEPVIKTVKLADLISNLRSVIVHDHAFAKTYIREKMLLLNVLREGDSTLWEMAYEICRDYLNKESDDE